MKNHYQNSPDHLQNAEKARQKSLEKTEVCKYCLHRSNKAGMLKHQTACLANDNLAKFCGFCDVRIFKHGVKFCSSSCSAKHNNLTRIITPEHKAAQAVKTSRALKGRPSPRRGVSRTKHYPVSERGRITEERKCYVCNGTFTYEKHASRKSCSETCKSKAASMRGSNRSGKWGKKLSIPYQTLSGTVVNLESNWELAIASHLDKHCIAWSRPEPIAWVDSTGKHRSYFADFYLPEFGVYLDPKNPWVLKRDEEKISEIRKKITLLVGNPTDIIAELCILQTSIGNLLE